MSSQHLSYHEMFLDLYKLSLQHVMECLDQKDDNQLPIEIGLKFPDLPPVTVEIFKSDQNYIEFIRIKTELIKNWTELVKQMKMAVQKSSDCRNILQTVWRMNRNSKIQHLKAIHLTEDQRKKNFHEHFRVLLAVEEIFKLTGGQSNVEDTVEKRSDIHKNDGKTETIPMVVKHKRHAEEDDTIHDDVELQKETELRNQSTEIEALESQIRQLQIEKISLQKEFNRCSDQLRQVSLPKAKDDYSKLKKENSSLKEENDALTLRLSMLAGRKLTDNNPAIANLGDSNRPQKLSERFREIYDNSWTDLLECFTTTYTEEKMIQHILVSLQGIYELCINNTKKTTMEVQRVIGYPDYCALDMDRQNAESKPVKDFVLKTVEYRVNSIIKEIKELRCVKDLLDLGGVHADIFITACSQTCLYMSVQDPPVILDFSFGPGDPFNTDLLCHYTSSGEQIDYLVWPAMYLHEHGAVLCKGVAQGKSMATFV